MRTRRRGRWVLNLIVAGLVVGACILVYTLVPGSTTLVISVVDADTQAPLSGAMVEVRPRSAQPLPPVTTDEEGVARFEDLPPEAIYSVQIQKVDYDLAIDSQVTVPEGQETVLTVPLTPHAGKRLFVGLNGARLAIVDTASLLTVQTIRLPVGEQEPVRYLLSHPTEDLLYIIVNAEGHILDSRSGMHLGRLEIETPFGNPDPIGMWGLSNDGQRLFAIGTWHRGPLMILDAHTGQLLAEAPLHDVGVTPEAFIVQKSHGAGMYVLRFGDEAAVVETLSSAVQQMLDGLPVGVLTGAVLSTDERYVYEWLGPWYFGQETNRLRDQLHIRQIDTKPTILTTRTLATGISALAASPTKQEVYVLNAMLGTLTIFDPVGQAPPTLIAVGKEPVALAVSADGTWAYVANRESQTISVVHLPLASVVHTIPLLGEPLSLAIR